MCRAPGRWELLGGVALATRDNCRKASWQEKKHPSSCLSFSSGFTSAGDEDGWVGRSCRSWDVGTFYLFCRRLKLPFEVYFSCLHGDKAALIYLKQDSALR